MRNRNRILALIIAGAMVLAILVPTILFFTDAVNASSSKLEEQNRLASEAKDKKNQAASERKNLEAENEKLNNEINALAGDISSLNSDIITKEQQIKENEERINQLSEEIEKSDEMLKERLRVMYEQGSTSYLDILFSSKGLSDMLVRLDMVTQLYQHDQKLISDLSSKRKETTEKKAQIEKDKVAIESERDVLASKQDEFDVKVDKNNTQVAQLKEDEAYYDKIQKQHEQEAKNILNEIAAQKAAAAKKNASKNNSSTVISSGTGSLGLPCSGGTITSEFGYRTLRGRQNYHTGIDFAVPSGSSVLACADGVVLSSGWRGSYGYCVTIDHGNLVTLYAHNSSLLVSAGQKVVRGQKIANSGSTGNSTGPHVHLSVIVNGQYVNPRPYLW